MTEGQITEHAERLAAHYVGKINLVGLEKERLYALKAQYPEIHYRALKINGGDIKGKGG